MKRFYPACLLISLCVATAAQSAEKTASDAASLFFIQAGAFRTADGANIRCAPLTELGLPFSVTHCQGLFFCRSSGDYERPQAEEVLQAVKTQTQLKDVILVRADGGRQRGQTGADAGIPARLVARFEHFMREQEGALPPSANTPLPASSEFQSYLRQRGSTDTATFERFLREAQISR